MRGTNIKSFKEPTAGQTGVITDLQGCRWMAGRVFLKRMTGRLDPAKPKIEGLVGLPPCVKRVKQENGRGVFSYRKDTADRILRVNSVGCVSVELSHGD